MIPLSWASPHICYTSVKENKNERQLQDWRSFFTEQEQNESLKKSVRWTTFTDVVYSGSLYSNPESFRFSPKATDLI
jgi:hypothetical protein